MTENDIKGNFAAIRDLSELVAGADLDPGEREVVKTLVSSGLTLLEAFLVDVNRASAALEVISKYHQIRVGDREQGF
jgi:hypothetical protein